MRTDSLRILQIGAGSMGTRRLRDLSNRSDLTLAVFDAREDRRKHAADRFGTESFAEFDAAMNWRPNALIISTPPDVHDKYVHVALEVGLHHFCEANIRTADPKFVERTSAEKKLISAASNSLHFLPVVRELKRIVREELGTLHAYQMSLSTYMPDWHPTEGKEYYARHRDTAAGREMVPFELLWLNDVFGAPAHVSGSVRLRGQLPGVREDVWALQAVLESGASAQLLVLMGSPGALRAGCCFGDRGNLQFDLFAGTIRRNFPGAKVDDVLNRGAMKDVLEETYRIEIETFIAAIRGEAKWPHSYHDAAVATATLAALEQSAGVTTTTVPIDVHVQPRHLS